MRHQGWSGPLHQGHRACFISICVPASCPYIWNHDWKPDPKPIDVTGNPLPPAWFGETHHKLHRAKRGQRRGTPQRAFPNKTQNHRGKSLPACGWSLSGSPVSDSKSPASREQQTNTLVTARRGGHTKPVLFQDKTTETTRRSSGFTNPQSLMSQFHITPGLVLHRELPEATVLLPALGMPSRLLSCPPSHSRMEIITAAQAHKIHLSVEIHTHVSSVELPCSQAIMGHREKMERMRNPRGMVGQSLTSMHSHSYPRLKWSYVQMGFQEKGCNVIFHCISFSTMRCAVLAQNSPRLLYIGFIPYSNE